MPGANSPAKAIEGKSPWYCNLSKTMKDLTLFLVSAFVLYKVVNINRHRRKENRMGRLQSDIKTEEKSSELKQLDRDFTVKELHKYDGSRPDGRILLAVNFKVYDVTSAVHFYGEDGAYPQYAGCDISRNLINFSMEKNDMQDFDDLSDLTDQQRRTLLEWAEEYEEKYPCVGRLVQDNIGESAGLNDLANDEDYNEAIDTEKPRFMM